MTEVANVTGASPEPARRSGRERRLVLRLLDYWRGVVGDRTYPSMSDIRSDDITDMWPFCFILDVDDNKENPILRYVGEELVACYGAPCENLRVSELRKDSLLACVTAYAGEILRKGVPISYGDSFKGEDGEGVLCRSILLPLSDDDETISLILGGANYLKNPKPNRMKN
ncbi:PAS domain-containing protein [Rhodospirillaceae bacterium AH-315-P19]|nr:PAS domain-containing protein [Rhodospirillaceae bacterium AH-315-P19]